jgi:RNase P subunit RPR2
MTEKRLVSEIAKDRIDILMDQAAIALEGSNPRPDLAKKYLRIAKQISTHYKVHSKRLRKEVCKSCNTLLIPGKTCKVIVASSKRSLIYKCLSCNKEVKKRY